jgi:fumarylacetoacetate (FAA) hydrolase
MKLASLKEGGRDGTLVVVDKDLKRAVRATGIAPTLQKAIEDWAALSSRLAELAEELRDDKAVGSFELDTKALAAPLPTSCTSNSCARRAVSRCRRRSGPTR